MKRKLFMSFFLFLVALLQLQAQERSIRGKVISAEDGLPLPGVTIMIKGTNIGTITDMDGNYVLTVPEKTTTLVFSFVGMKTQELPITVTGTLNVKMESDQLKLDEVVVVGYGTSSRRALTGSIQKVTTSDLITNTSSNIAVALQGRASGVQITQNSGAPDAGVNIRVRGVSSINSGGEPLIVVDGMPSGMSFTDINPADIESIEILKDASSAAIYGSRAANGVVLITTKKGTPQKSEFTVEYQHGFSNPTRLLDLASGPDLMRIMDTAYKNELPTRPDKSLVLPLFNYDGFTRSIAESTNTDWIDLVTQNAYYNQYAFSASGGTNETRFYTSLQYRDEYGFSAGEHFQRATGRLNLEHKATNWLTFGANLTLTYRFKDLPYASLNDAYTNLLTLYPVYSPARPGKYFYDRNTSGNQGINPLYRRDETWNDNQNFQTFDLAYLQLKPLHGLTLRSEWGIKYTGTRSRGYQSREYRRPGDGIDPKQAGAIQYGRYQTYYWNTNNTITYEKEFGDHNITLLGGYTMDSYSYDGNGLTMEGFPSDYFTLTNANTEVVQTRQSATIEEYRFMSYIGRARYAFKNRYFAELQYRRDGSSRFGPEYRWGDFPGGAVSWIASDEQFLKDVTWLNHLKVRLSVGTVGNAEIGNYPYLSSLVGWAPFGYTPGFLFNNIGNKTIHWEKQVQTDFGLDFALFNGIATGSFDYFSKDQNDLIVSNKIGNFHGYFATDINVNLGDMTTKGFDFNITFQNIKKRDFEWKTDFNISHFKSKINKLSDAQKWIAAGRNIVVEGQPLGAYYLPIWAGVDPETGHEMIYGVNQAKAENRQAYEKDLSGQILDGNQLPSSQFNNQSVIYTSKTPYPDVYGGLNNTFFYKNFDFSFLFTYQFGNYIYNDAERVLSYAGVENNVSPKLLEGWTPSNPTNVPLLWNSAMSGRHTTRYLYDGSYIRLKNVQLGYNLPANVAKRLYMKNVRFYVIAQNLLTFTKYEGQDPEFFNAADNREANLSPGIDKLGNYPQMKSVSFGINLGF